MKKNTKIYKMVNQCKEYIYRFELKKSQIFSQDTEAIALVIGENIKAILDVVVLTYKGKEIEVDGFKFVENDNEIYTLYPRVLKCNKKRNQ